MIGVLPYCSIQGETAQRHGTIYVFATRSCIIIKLFLKMTFHVYAGWKFDYGHFGAVSAATG